MGYTIETLREASYTNVVHASILGKMGGNYGQLIRQEVLLVDTPRLTEKIKVELAAYLVDRAGLAAAWNGLSHAERVQVADSVVNRVHGEVEVKWYTIEGEDFIKHGEVTYTHEHGMSSGIPIELIDVVDRVALTA